MNTPDATGHAPADLRREADRAYRDARRALDAAAAAYQLAAAHAAHARWLTTRPDLWETTPRHTGNPAWYEHAAADAERHADRHLTRTFDSTARARQLYHLAADAPAGHDRAAA